MKKMVMKRKESENVKKNVMKKVEKLIKMGFNLDNILEKAEKENIKLNYEKVYGEDKKLNKQKNKWNQ